MSGALPSARHKVPRSLKRAQQSLLRRSTSRAARCAARPAPAPRHALRLRPSPHRRRRARRATGACCAPQRPLCSCSLGAAGDFFSPLACGARRAARHARARGALTAHGKGCARAPARGAAAARWAQGGACRKGVGTPLLRARASAPRKESAIPPRANARNEGDTCQSACHAQQDTTGAVGPATRAPARKRPDFRSAGESAPHAARRAAAARAPCGGVGAKDDHVDPAAALMVEIVQLHASDTRNRARR